jgi:hypothetical protein
VSIEVKDEENEGKLRMDVGSKYVDMMLTDGCDIHVIRWWGMMIV